jgi:hypothetical protein
VQDGLAVGDLSLVLQTGLGIGDRLLQGKEMAAVDCTEMYEGPAELAVTGPARPAFSVPFIRYETALPW